MFYFVLFIVKRKKYFIDLYLNLTDFLDTITIMITKYRAIFYYTNINLLSIN